MAVNEFRYVCRYNENIRCMDRDCGKCGWNPAISESRLEAYQKKNGIKKREPKTRLIDAVSAVARIATVITPMVEKGFSQHRILAEVLKIISASRIIEAEPVTRCYECKYSEESNDTSKKAGTLVCCNKQTPCNRRTVSQEFYCPYGERKTDGKEND